MAEDDKTGPVAPGATPESGGASLSIASQYIRDLSFESPAVPAATPQTGGKPGFNVNIAVNVKKLEDEIYAVELSLTAKAEREGAIMFNVELVYGGVFRVRGVPDDRMGLVLMVECPRLLFPFARQVIASITQAGGFPPLMMDPVDFLQIYRQNLANLQKRAPAGGGNTIN